MYSVPYSTVYQSKMDHQYITNCESLVLVRDYFIGIMTFYAIFAIMWGFSVWFLYDEYPHMLQKALIIIPIFKILRMGLYGVYMS